MKLPIPATTEIKRVSQTATTGIDEFASLLKNVTVEMVEGKPRASRRLGIEVITNGDASVEAISPTVGRGIYWSTTAATSTILIANYNTVYKGNYNTSMGTFGAGAAAQGNQKMFFTTVNDGTYDTVVIDPAVNMGAAIATLAGTFTSITAALPTILNAGVVWLNGRLFVCGKNQIYNSDLNDVTAGYTDFVSAEREGDSISAIVRHHDHIIALGITTTEFFYHDDNPGSSGSPLRRRQDIYYNVGLLDMAAFVEANDVIYFLGFGEAEGIGLYRISNFQLEKISDARFDRYIGETRSTTSALNYLTAVSYEGRTLICVTHADASVAQVDFDDQVYTFVFEEDGRSYVWDTDGIGQLSEFPVVGCTHINAQIAGGGAVTGGSKVSNRMLMSNGDIVRFLTRFESPDTFKDNLGTKTGFNSTIEFPDFDGDMTGWKFCHAVEPYGEYEDDCEFTLSWSDDGGAYNTPHTLTKENRQRVVSCGRFSRRKFRLNSIDNSATIDEHMEIGGLDADIEPGTY